MLALYTAAARTYAPGLFQDPKSRCRAWVTALGVEAAHEGSLAIGGAIEALLKLLQILDGDLTDGRRLLIEGRGVTEVPGCVGREVTALGQRGQ